MKGIYMAYIIWSEMFSVRVPYIDNQHRKLIQIINNFYDALKDPEASMTIFQTLNELFHYTELHFKDEEEIMHLIQYPASKLEKHKLAHENITEQIFKLNDQLNRGDERTLYNLESFLNNWIIKHILEMDKAYQPYTTRYRANRPRQIMESDFYRNL